MSLIKALFDQFKTVTPQEKNRNLIRREAEIGGRLFGEVPKGHRRDFFYLGDNTWIWHEGWRDAKGKEVVVTTRYEVYPEGVLKVQDGQPHQRVSAHELQNLHRACQEYFRSIKKQLYTA